MLAYTHLTAQSNNAQNSSGVSVPAHSQQSTPLPNYVRNPEYTLTGFGVYGGFDAGLHRANFTYFSAFPQCCAPSSFGSAIGTGWAAGATFDHSLTNWLMLDVRAGVSSGRVELAQTENMLAITRAGRPEELPIRFSNEIQLTTIHFDPALKVRLLPLPTTITYAPSLYLSAGLGLRYFVGQRFSSKEMLMTDTVNFLLDNGRISNVRNSIDNQEIPLFNRLQVSPFLGLESDIFLESEYPANWVIAPYIRYYFGIQEMATGLIAREKTGSPSSTPFNFRESTGSWRMDGAQAGLTFKYRLYYLQKHP
ncbi:MAG: hypothetical protein EAZ92_13570 [Candidatus Kapaibacterium sp.]|nr:MAG: hypothetical protein EAZ92_13570 [Candidatus Kapabacteria bacterium]